MSRERRSRDLRLDPQFVQRALKQAGLRARHNLSQNFLADVDVLEAILREADPGPGRGVLEIGPGLGFLTGGLLAAGADVTAVELDRGLASVLRERFAAEGEAGVFHLIEDDALDQDLVNLVPPPYDVVANLPYHITSPILHRLLGNAPRAERLVLMVQREVGERVVAPPGLELLPEPRGPVRLEAVRARDLVAVVVDVLEGLADQRSGVGEHLLGGLGPVPVEGPGADFMELTSLRMR